LRSRSRIWVPVLAASLVVLLALVDALTGDHLMLVPLYVLGPLVAALASSERATAAVGALASVLGAIVLAKRTELSAGQDLVRVATVVFGSAVAIWVAALRERLRAINAEQGATFVVIEHNMEFVMSLCTRILVLAEGRIIAEGTPSEIRANPAVIEAYLGN